MTPFTFAVLITSLVALAAVIPAVKPMERVTIPQMVLFYGGIFGFLWACFTLIADLFRIFI